MSEGGHKRRPVRPSALKAQQTFLTTGADAHEQASSDEDGGGYGERRPPRRNVSNAKVDLYKLDATALQRYRRVYKLGEAPGSATREDLLPAVARHFAAQVLDEEDVLVKFVLAIQKHAGRRTAPFVERIPSTHSQAPGPPGGIRKVVRPASLPLPFKQPSRR